MSGFIIGLDQSTQGTKGLLFDKEGHLIAREDEPHEQKLGPQGHISHDPNEIYGNVKKVVTRLLSKNGIRTGEVLGIGISNQRETTLAWDHQTGKPFCDAVVWQCARAEKICRQISEEDGDYIRKHTGLRLSPYFPASKMAWILQNCTSAREAAVRGKLCLGTMDSWLCFKMTEGVVFATDYSNASRTQLFDLHSLSWNDKLCQIFGVPKEALARVQASDSLFGETRLDGLFDRPVPIHAVMGDSHAALFGQNCRQSGQMKVTYGTGSSLMLNTGGRLVESEHGLVTSIAWKAGGRVEYVLEGNLNDTGAVVSWLKNGLGLISSAAETEKLAFSANPEDMTYLVPAFSGLGAPYWKSQARALLLGMNRKTGRAEIVKAALDCIAYQVTDILLAARQDSGMELLQLRADGGPTKNRYLMQLQSDMVKLPVLVSETEELSGAGAAYMAGIALKIYDDRRIFAGLCHHTYRPQMRERTQKERYEGWKEAVRRAFQDINT